MTNSLYTVVRRSIRLALAAAGVIATLAAAGAPAKAGLFLSVSDGTTTKTFFDASNNLFASAAMGAYTLEINLVSTNFPGDPAGGTLATSAQFSTSKTTAAPNLTIIAEVVDSATPDGSGGFIAGPLSIFTSPFGNPLKLSNDTSASRGNATAGTFDFSSTANAVTVTDTNVSIPNFVRVGSSTQFSGPSGYTLTNQIVIKGVNKNAANVTVQGTSTVTAVVPEPASFVALATAIPVVGLGAMLRRRKAQA